MKVFLAITTALLFVLNVGRAEEAEQSPFINIPAKQHKATDEQLTDWCNPFSKSYDPEKCDQHRHSQSSSETTHEPTDVLQEPPFIEIQLEPKISSGSADNNPFTLAADQSTTRVEFFEHSGIFTQSLPAGVEMKPSGNIMLYVDGEMVSLTKLIINPEESEVVCRLLFTLDTLEGEAFYQYERGPLLVLNGEQAIMTRSTLAPDGTLNVDITEQQTPVELTLQTISQKVHGVSRLSLVGFTDTTGKQHTLTVPEVLTLTTVPVTYEGGSPFFSIDQ